MGDQTAAVRARVVREHLQDAGGTVSAVRVQFAATTRADKPCLPVAPRLRHSLRPKERPGTRSARFGKHDPRRDQRLSIVALKPLGLVLAFGAMHLSQGVSVDPLRVIDKKAHGENISTAGTRDRDRRPLKRVARHEGRAMRQPYGQPPPSQN